MQGTSALAFSLFVLLSSLQSTFVASVQFVTPKPESDLTWHQKTEVDPHGNASFRSLNLTTGSRCLDGSQYGFYIRLGDPQNWTIILDDGEYCQGEDGCAELSHTRFGSSSNWNATKKCACKQHDNDGKESNCTCVILPACDGAFFSGYRSKAVTTESGKELMIRGGVNLNASIATLMNHYGLYDAKEVILYGASMGAVGVLLNIDEVATLFSSSTVVSGLVSNGYLLNHSDMSGSNVFAYKMSNIYDYHKLRVNSACAANNSENPWLCLVGSTVVPYVQTPVFFIQSMLDAWSLKNILGVGCFSGAGSCSTEDLNAMDHYSDDYLANIKPVYKLTKEGTSYNSFYLTSCICQGDECPWGDNEVLTPNIWEMFNSWLRARPATGDDFVKLDRRSASEAGELDGCEAI